MVALGAGLAAVAGAVDVLAFTQLGQTFASVVTGNLVVIGVAVGEGDLLGLAHAATALLSYAAGVLLGSIGIRRVAGTNVRWPVQSSILCAVELVVLAGLAWLWLDAGGRPRGATQYLALVAAALAMGLQTAAFRVVAVHGVTTTYFTGTLTGLLADLVVHGQLRMTSLVALLALLAGAAASGLLVAHALGFAVILPLGLLVVVLVVSLIRRKALWHSPRPTV